MSDLKEALQEKIERNAVKIPNISWTDMKGKVHTEDVILKRSKFPLVGDWARIYPPVEELDEIDPKTGKRKIRTLWINTIFGGKKNLIKLLIILGLIGMVFFSVKDVITQYEALKESCEPFLDVIQ